MDCFSGEIVALEMRDNMKKELCIDTVRQLKRLYPSLVGAVIHSDRGSQYTSVASARSLRAAAWCKVSAALGTALIMRGWRVFSPRSKRRRSIRSRLTSCQENRSRRSFSGTFLPITIAFGSIRAILRACRPCATGSGRPTTGRAPLSTRILSAFQILGVFRLHIS